MADIGGRLKHAWNAFVSRDQRDTLGASTAYSVGGFSGGGVAYGGRPDRVRYTSQTERSLTTSIYTRISIDASLVAIRHVRVDQEGRYIGQYVSGLNNCLTVEANIDQAATAFQQDIVQTVLDKGAAAIVPVDTSINPILTGGYDILTMRVGEIKEWYPQHVKISLWNEAKGRREDITLPKRNVAIVENPLYAVMNEPNSTLKRLIRKLNLLDAVDEASSSGKLDLIIQLPYVVKTAARKVQAENRRTDIQDQLKNSTYGIAYTEGDEKIVQLNRPTENNLLKQIEYLTNMLYGQLGLTEDVMNGTASETSMLNYNNRTLSPLLTAITEAMIRSFITKTGRTQGQSIQFYRDPFRLVPISQIAEIADKLSRNEIMTANEFRQALGLKPSSDPKADQLVNSNMPAPSEPGPTVTSN